MPDTTTTETDAPAIPAPGVTPAPDAPESDPAADTTVLERALKAEREMRKTAERQAKELADRERAREDADKSETERLAGRIAALEAKEKSLQAEIAQRDQAELKRRVAAKHKLPESFAARLIGADEPALDEDAKAIAKELDVARTAAAVVPGSPRAAPPPSGAQVIERTVEELRATGRYRPF